MLRVRERRRPFAARCDEEHGVSAPDAVDDSPDADDDAASTSTDGAVARRNSMTASEENESR